MGQGPPDFRVFHLLSKHALFALALIAGTRAYLIACSNSNLASDVRGTGSPYAHHLSS